MKLADIDVINTLDGFNLQPRLSIPFSGHIDVSTVTSNTLFLVRLGHRHGDERVGINQVVWDPTTKTLHAESDEFLEQRLPSPRRSPRTASRRSPSTSSVTAAGRPGR